MEPHPSYSSPCLLPVSPFSFPLPSLHFPSPPFTFPLFFHSILRWSVAVSTMRRQSSRIAAFLQADARPMFCWPRSASTARNQVWLGLPNCRFQSGGSPRITAATARWWSSCGELRAICPKSRKRLSVTRWERGRHPVVALTSTGVSPVDNVCSRSFHTSTKLSPVTYWFLYVTCSCMRPQIMSAN